VVRVVAEEHMAHESGALIDVTSTDGDGGFVELSGHGSLAIRGDVDIGNGGALLIDPAILLINAGGGAPGTGSTSGVFTVGETFIEGQLNAGVDVALIASDAINASATLTIDAVSVGAGDLAIKIGTVGIDSVTGTLDSGTAFNCLSDGFCAGVAAGLGFIGFTPDTNGNVNLQNVSFNLSGSLTVAGGTTTGNVNLNNINVAGNVSLTAGDDVRLFGSVAQAGGSFTVTAGNNIDAVNNLALTAGGSVTLNATELTAAGTSISVDAGSFSSLNLNAEIGKTAPLNADVSLQGENVNINKDIRLANNTLTLSGNGGESGGGVFINGSSTEKRTVSTQGTLNVRGDHFVVQGATVPLFSPPSDVQVDVQASVIDVSVSGDVTISGGNFLPTSAVGSGTASVSASVTASNDISITANSLTVNGGFANANGSFGSTILTVDANATLEAGGNLTANLGSALNVSGGTANANANGVSQVMTANADALMKAGGNLNVTAGLTNLTKGTENPAGTGIANASANSMVEGNNITLNVGGGLSVSSANVVATTNVNITAGTYTENINNSIQAGNNLSVSAGGNYNVVGNYIAGNLLSLSAGNTLDLNIDLGASGAVLNHDVTLAGNNVIIDQKIHLGNNALTIAGGAGTVSIGSTGSGSSATIATAGQMSITANDLNVNNAILQGGNVGINLGGSFAASNADISADSININAASITDNSSNIYTAAGNLTVAVGGDYDVNGSYNAGNLLSLSAGNTLDLNIDLGASGAVLNHDVTLAGNNVIIDQNIHLGNNALTIAGGAGTVSILGSSAAPLTVSTQGVLSITGNNLVVKDTTTGSASVSPSVGVAASTIDIVLTGNMDISAGSYTATSAVSSPVSVNASVVASNDISIIAQNLSVKGGSAVAATGSNALTVTANAKLDAGGDLTLNISNDINVDGGNALADADRTAEANADITAGGNVTITAANVNLDGGTESVSGTGAAVASAKSKLQAGSALSVTATDNITGNNADISANGMYMEAGNNIDLATSNIMVGNGTVAGIEGDAVTLAFLATKGITPPTTANPNAKFRAGGELNMGTITMDGDIPYLWLEADTTNLAGLTLPEASDVVVQFSPYTLTATITVEDEPVPTNTFVNYNNLEHFGILPGTTIIIGSSLHTGDIIIGDLGEVDIVSKNMVAVTSSSISSISNVISTGIVAELIIGGFNNEFVTPVLTEVQVSLDPVDDPSKEKEKKKNLVEDDEEEIKECKA